MNGLQGSALGLRTHSHSRVRNMKGHSAKKRPPISPAWIHPGLVIGGARSRNHKKTRPRCDTHRAHFLDRSLMYAELKIANRFHRVTISGNPR